MKRIIDVLKLYKNNAHASAAVEFALIAIPFLIIIFGVMEAGRLVWTINGVRYAVEETGRYASINSGLGNDNFQDYAEDKMAEMNMDSESLQITSSTVTSNGIDFVQVVGTYSHATMLNGFIPGGFGNFDLDASVRKPVIN